LAKTTILEDLSVSSYHYYDFKIVKNETTSLKFYYRLAETETWTLWATITTNIPTANINLFTAWLRCYDNVSQTVFQSTTATCKNFVINTK
jgi:hypothetical protein